MGMIAAEGFLISRIAKLRRNGMDDAAVKAELQNLGKFTDEQIDSAIAPQVKPPSFSRTGRGGRRHDAQPVSMDFKPLGDYRMQNPRWLWADRIAYGELNILVGDPETLKTTIAIDVAARCTAGGKWPLTDYKVEPCWVMWIGTSENAPTYTLLPRIRAAGGDASKVLVHQGTTDSEGRKRPFAISRDIEMLRAKIREVREDGKDVRLVIFDPTPEFLGPDVDSWKDDQVRALLGPLTELAKQEEFAIIGIMHPRKATDADRVLSNIAGSGAWGWLSRSIMFTKRLRDEDGNDTDEFVIMWEKTTLAAQHPRSIKYKAASVPVEPVNEGDETVTSAAAIEWLEETDIRLRDIVGSSYSRRATKKEEAIEWLKDELRDGPVLVKEIGERARARDISEKTLRRAIDDLGIISKPREMSGPYWMELPPDPFAPQPIEPAIRREASPAPGDVPPLASEADYGADRAASDDR